MNTSVTTESSYDENENRPRSMKVIPSSGRFAVEDRVCELGVGVSRSLGGVLRGRGAAAAKGRILPPWPIVLRTRKGENLLCGEVVVAQIACGTPAV